MNYRLSHGWDVLTEEQAATVGGAPGDWTAGPPSDGRKRVGQRDNANTEGHAQEQLQL